MYSQVLQDEKNSNLLGKSFSTRDMWTLQYLGLYSNYAAVGLITGSMGVSYNFCVYYYDGPTNLCANAKNIQMLAWSFKFLFAIITDRYGSRKPFILAGWLLAIFLLVFLAIFAHTLSASLWIVVLACVNACMLLADVPADGYSIELSRFQNDDDDFRGSIVSTGQTIRWLFATFAGIIQTLLLNGPSTNKDDCSISWSECWNWGLTINQFYWLLASLVFVCYIPMLYLVDTRQQPLLLDTQKQCNQHNNQIMQTQSQPMTLTSYINQLWNVLLNYTTFRLIVYVVGIHCFTNFISIAAIYLQYYVIELTNLQIGIDSITTSLSTGLGIFVFQRYLVHYNWRYTTYLSILFTSFFSLLWIFAFYNTFNLRNGWFTIFIDIDQSFSEGISKVLSAMVVIEIAPNGLEASTYELIVSVSNGAMSFATIIATQLISVVNGNSCVHMADDEYDDDDYICSTGKVDLSSQEAFEASNGPFKYTLYTSLLIGISILACIVFARFLPADRDQIQLWTQAGIVDSTYNNVLRARFATIVIFIVVGYVFISAIMLLNAETSCLTFFGGSGC